MSNKFAIALLLIFSLFLLGACSNSSDNKQSNKNKSKTENKESVNNFADNVNNVCLGVDQDVFVELASASNESTSNIDRFQKALQGAEDEMDKSIGKFDALNAPESASDDWETFLDDLSAIRDSYPDLLEKFKELTTAMEDANSLDPAIQSKAESDIEKIQSDIEPIIEDQNQRYSEIKKISKNLKFDNCDVFNLNGGY